MAAPVINTCLADLWSIVATNVWSARLWFLSRPINGGRLLYTYRPTGAAAPANLTDAVIVPAKAPDRGSVVAVQEHGEPVDIYVYAEGSAVDVRVDTPLASDLAGGVGGRTIDEVYDALSPGGVEFESDPFVAAAQSVSCVVAAPDPGFALGTVRVRIQQLVGAVWGNVGGAASWSVALGSGVAAIPCDGLALIPGQTYRFVVQFAEASIDAPVTIWAYQHQGDTAPGKIPALEIPLVDVASLAVDTYHYPSILGMVLGRYTDVSIDALVTGTADPSIATGTMQIQKIPGGPWRDISLSGFDALVGTHWWTSVHSASAVAAVRDWHFDRINCYAWRFQVVVADFPSGPVEISGRMQ